MKFFLLTLTLCLALFLTSCANEPSIISVSELGENITTPETTEKTLTVNISSHTVHFSSSCRHVKNAKANNLRTIAYTSDALHTLIAMDYSLCSSCREQT